MTFDSRKILLFFEKIDKSLTFWRRRPAYYMTGPSGDREYLYSEGDHVLWICVDWLSGETGIDIVVDRNSVSRWDPPYHNEVISREKCQEIFDNVSEYLTNNGASFEWR